LIIGQPFMKQAAQIVFIPSDLYLLSIYMSKIYESTSCDSAEKIFAHKELNVQPGELAEVEVGLE
jgi:hypothetical protein